jgi:WD40 repeat protein
VQAAHAACKYIIAMMRYVPLWFFPLLVSWLSFAGQTAPELVLNTGHAGYVDRLEFSVDGATLLTHSEEGSIRVWDLRKNTILRVWDRDPMISDRTQPFAISGSGDHLLFGKLNGAAQMVAVSSGAEVGSGYVVSLKLPNGELPRFDPLMSVAESPDGAWVVGSNFDGAVVAFSTKGDSARIIQRSGSPALRFWFNSQSTRLVFENRDRSLRLYDLETALRSQSSEGYKLSNTAALAFNNAGALLKADSGGATVTVTNMTEGGVRRIPCPGCIHAMLSADGTRVAAIQGTEEKMLRVRRWSTSDLSELTSLATPPVVYRAGINADGSTVALGGFDGTVWVTSESGLLSLGGRFRVPRSLELLPRRQLLVIDTDGGIREWNAARASSAMVLRAGVLSRTALSPNGEFIALAGADLGIELSNPETNKFDSLGIQLPEHGTYSLRVSEDGNGITWTTGSITFNDDMKLPTSGSTELEALRTTVSARFSVFAASRKEGWKAKEVCTGERPIGIFHRGKLLTANCSTVGAPQGAPVKWTVRTIAARGELILYSGDGKAAVWDSTGVTEFTTHSALSTSSAISPDGKFAVIEGVSYITVLDLVKKKLLFEWIPPYRCILSPGRGATADLKSAYPKTELCVLSTAQEGCNSILARASPCVHSSVSATMNGWSWTAPDDLIRPTSRLRVPPSSGGIQTNRRSSSRLKSSCGISLRRA